MDCSEVRRPTGPQTGGRTSAVTTRLVLASSRRQEREIGGPDLLGPLGNGIRGQTLAGAAAAFVGALFAAKFLERWFRTRTLSPFAIYRLVAGAISIVHLA